jgi:hypothetical protein
VDACRCRARCGKLIACAENCSPWPREHLDCGKVRSGGCNDRALVEQAAGREELIARLEVASACPDMPGCSERLVDDRDVIFAADDFLDHDPVGFTRDRCSGEDADALADA